MEGTPHGPSGKQPELCVCRGTPWCHIAVAAPCRSDQSRGVWEHRRGNLLLQNGMIKKLMSSFGTRVTPLHLWRYIFGRFFKSINGNTISPSPRYPRYVLIFLVTPTALQELSLWLQPTQISIDGDPFFMFSRSPPSWVC